MIYGEEIDTTLEVELWACRTYGDITYVGALTAFVKEQLESWSGRYLISDNSKLFRKALLSGRFRTNKDEDLSLGR